jgi:HEPN domain-containing protein
MEELSALKADIIAVANSIRSLRVNLTTATKEPETIRKLADGIPPHIYKSANDILRMSAASISSSVWELHLAMEKSLKVLIRQKGGIPDNAHDLTNLLNMANGLQGVSLDPGLLCGLPSHHEAISHRYGEAPELAIDRASTNYRLSLTVVTEVTAALSRKFFMKNAKFLIKLPPWQS